MARLLVVDDDRHILELVRIQMARLGHTVLSATDGKQALDLLEGSSVDLAIVDVMMPEMDGWELCRLLKEHYAFPVMLLTAKGETAQKVKGLDLGADDYLVKPFDFLELAARVRALLRRYKIERSHRLEVGCLTLDLATRSASRAGRPLPLPRKEFELLFKLASFPGRTFSREWLLDELWDFDFDGTERTIDVHINRLRARFPEGQFGFRIVTARGLGYRLELDDEEV